LFKESLEKLGFVQSSYDECLFTRNGLVVLCHVDDCLLFHKDDAQIDSFMQELKDLLPANNEAVESSEHMTVYQYLGIEVIMEHKGSHRTVTLKQTRLIKRILEAMQMANCNPRRTPANEEMLGMDKTGPPFHDTWDYASIVGMMMYLVNTRPDIQTAVHQCARFTHNAKKCHGEAAKHIARYLQGTSDRGLEFKLGNWPNLQLDAYVDSSFANLFSVEDPQDPISSKSRSGYVFYFCGCPIHWVSSLQKLTTVSVNESEYVALSECMRELLPMRGLAQELGTNLSIQLSTSTIKSKVFSDNSGAIGLAKAPSMKSRTRHLNQRYHFFRQHIGSEEHQIDLQHVRSENNIADHFSKCLGPYLFEKLRKLLMGW